MKLVMLGVVVILAGCTTVEPLGGGKFVVDCGGAMQPMMNCYKEAAKTCPSGFDVLLSENSGAMFGGAFDPYGAAATGLNGVEKSLMIACH